jgi:type II secretory pathway component PulJ
MRARPGFTLLELLLATASAATLMLSLYAAMNVAFKARASVLRQTTAPRQAMILLDIVERALQSALPPAGVVVDRFVGLPGGAPGNEADALEWYAIEADADAADNALGEGLRRIRLERVTESGQNLLLLRRQRNLLSSVEQATEDEVLARQVEQLAIRYHDGYEWHNSWDTALTAQALPAAVELTVRLSDPDRAGGAFTATRVIPLSMGASADASLLGGLP